MASHVSFVVQTSIFLGSLDLFSIVHDTLLGLMHFHFDIMFLDFYCTL